MGELEPIAGWEPGDELEVAIARALQVLKVALANPREITPPLLLAWALVLRYAAVSPAEVERGTACCLQSQAFFPSPAEFLKLLRPPADRGEAEAAAEVAWQHVLTCVRRYGGRASLCAADLGGGDAGERTLWALSRVGWEALCAGLTDENRAIKRAEFVRVYQVAGGQAGGQAGGKAGEGVAGARLAYLVGACERENLAESYGAAPALAGRPDWEAWPAERPRVGSGQEPWQPRPLPAPAVRKALSPGRLVEAVDGFTALGALVRKVREEGTDGRG